MTKTRRLFSFAILVVTAVGQLFPSHPFDEGTPHIKDMVEKINQILSKTLALADAVAEIKSSVEDLDKRVDTLYHGATEWQPWTAFTSCSQTCLPADGSIGTQSRSRDCVFTVSPAVKTEAVCDNGTATETRNCTADKPCSAFAEQSGPLDYVGGNGGHAFSDGTVWNGENITAIRMNCKNHLLSIQLKYGDTWGSVHGLDFGTYACKNGTEHTYTLDNTEYIQEVLTRYGRYVNAITITTNKRVLPTCGRPSGSRRAFRRTRLLYISGRSGCVIDGVRLHWAIE